MEKVFDWSAPIVAAWSSMVQKLLEFLPQLVGAIVILVIGWLAAKAVRALTVRLVKSFDRVSNLIGMGDIVGAKNVNESFVTIFGNVVFWLVILFFLTAASNLIGLNMFAGWLDRLIGHLPNILSGALIILAGIVFGNLVNDATRTAANSLPSRQRVLLARAAQAFTVVTMIVIGVDQIGIDITVLITVFAIAIGALLGGVAIAFSLGSRTLVSNLLGARYLNKDYRVGEAIRISGLEGTILEVSSIAVILETSAGKATIPAKVFSEETSLLLTRESSNVE